jgi:signal transduction histidine kinase
MRLRIGAKSVGLFCIVGLLPVIILSVASFMSARDAMQRVVADNLALSARETVDNLERFFEATKTDLATWSQLRVMQDALIDDQEGEIATDLGQLISRYPQFAELGVLNAAGRVVASTDAEDRGRDWSGSDLFAQTRKGDSFQGTVAASTDHGHMTLTFAQPIRAAYDQATVIGTLVGAVDWVKVQQSLADVSLNGARQDADHVLVLVTRGDGGILYQTRQSASLPERPAAAPASAGGTSDGGLSLTSIGEREFLIESAASAPRGEFADPAWLLEAAVATDVAFAGIDAMRTRMIAIGIVTCLCALALGWLAARYLVRPITALTSVMRHTASGSAQAELPGLARQDEIGELVRGFRDMTAKLQDSREQLSRHERLATLGEVAATVSHELRNPLGAIRTSMEVVRMITTDSEPRLGRTLERIERNIGRCQRIIGDLLEFTQAKELTRERTGIDDWLAEMLARHALPAGVVCRRDLRYGGDAMIDRERLRQAVVNLVDNAAQALADPAWRPPQGHERSITIRTETAGPFVRIAVIDTGPGIEPATRAKIFEPLFTTKGFGVGLGLPTARQLVEQHGGTLQVESEPGHGATFVILLPARGHAAEGLHASIGADAA